MRRHAIGAPTLALVAAVTLVLAVGAGILITRDGSLLQQPPWAAEVLLVVMGGLVLWIAHPVRSHLRSGRRTSVEALRAARAVVLSQAAALTGAAASGWYLGQLGVVVRDLSLVANQQRVLAFALALIAAMVLVVCGMVAQSWCRIDEDDDDRPLDDPPLDDRVGAG